MCMYINKITLEQHKVSVSALTEKLSKKRLTLKERFSGALLKGKNLLPCGSKFYPLRMSPMRMENYFKSPLKDGPIKNHQILML